MSSPLDVLALSATSELNDQRRRRNSPDSTTEAAMATASLTPNNSSSTPLCLEQPSLCTHDNSDKQYEMLTQDPLTTWSPDRVHLRVDASSSALDPFAIELIESVLSKGTAVLSRPIFPYTYETEPQRYMEIRTHLRLRYAAVLERDAPLATRVAMTQQLLQLWGAKLVKTCEPSVVACTTSMSRPTIVATTTTSSSSLMPLQPQGRNHQGESNNTALILAVSPLKRPASKTKNPCTTTTEGGNKHKSVSLDPHIIAKGDTIMMMGQDDDEPQKQEAGPCPVVLEDVAPVVATPPPNRLVASKEAWLVQEETLSSKGDTSDRRVDASNAATATATTTTTTPTRCGVVVASKEILLTQHCKKQKLFANKKKKQLSANSAVRRIVRRWTAADRQLYLQALEKHGFGATEAIKRMVPGKSFEQIQMLGRAMREDFGIRPGQGPTDEIRECLNYL